MGIRNGQAQDRLGLRRADGSGTSGGPPKSKRRAGPCGIRSANFGQLARAGGAGGSSEGGLETAAGFRSPARTPSRASAPPVCGGAVAGIGNAGTGRLSTSASRIASRDEVVHHAAVTEPHLGLGGVHVHVHLFGVAVQEQQRERETNRRDQVVVGCRDGVQQQPVPNQPPVHEQEDRIAIQSSGLAAGRRTRAGRRRRFPRRGRVRDRRGDARRARGGRRHGQFAFAQPMSISSSRV